MTTERVPAASARRRTSAVLMATLTTCVVLWVLSVVVTVPDAVTAPDAEAGTAGALLGFVIVMIVLVMPFLDQGSRIRLEDERYLTAWTISGWRTVDLHHLMRVRRYQLAQDADYLLLEDVEGVRLQLDQKKIIDATRKALTDHPNGAVRMTFEAEYLLDLDLPTRPLKLGWFSVRTFGKPFAILPLWFGLTTLAFIAAEVVAVLGG
jgi:hypothetical protein